MADGMLHCVQVSKRAFALRVLHSLSYIQSAQQYRSKEYTASRILDTSQESRVVCCKGWGTIPTSASSLLIHLP